MEDLFDDRVATEGDSPEEKQQNGEATVQDGETQDGLTNDDVDEHRTSDHQELDTDEDDKEGGGGKELAGPRDEIKVSITQYQRSGEDFTYDVELEVNGANKLVHRNYKDLQWLHRNLMRKVELGGYILPPMPAPPPKAMDPKVAVLGETSQALFGDYNRLPCLAMETFLQCLADHRFFAENDTVHTHITNDQLSSNKEALGSGLWSSFTKTISDYKLGSVQDTDEDFKKFLKSIEELIPQLQMSSQTFAQMVSSQLSLGCAIVHLGELMEEHATWEGNKNDNCSIACTKIAENLEEEKRYLYASSLDSRHTLGFTLDLYHRYCIQAKEMLFRRLERLQTLINCTNQVEKAKPEKKDAAEVARRDADKAFQSISETAKKEIELFQQQYVKSFQSNLVGYAQSQIEHSKKCHENLTRLRDELAAIVIGGE